MSSTYQTHEFYHGELSADCDIKIVIDESFNGRIDLGLVSTSGTQEIECGKMTDWQSCSEVLDAYIEQLAEAKKFCKQMASIEALELAAGKALG